jgi:hypothetical protein
MSTTTTREPGLRPGGPPPGDPAAPRPRAGRALRAALGLLCVLLALAGAAIAIRTAAPTVDRVALGTVSTEIGPAWRGQVDAYVPIVDWGVRVRPFLSPLSVRLEFRALDREAAIAALRSGFAAQANLKALEHDLGDSVRGALRRAALFALAGAALGGLAGGALAAAVLYRRRWLAFGLAAGVATALVAVPLTGLGVARGDWKQALAEPTFYARGDELPRLLDFSEQLLTAGKDYTSTYDQAIASLSNLLALAGGGTIPAAPESTYVVASDLHLNRFALDALERYAQDAVVFQVGDFGLLGRGLEQDLAPQLATLGSATVAVSGNHDTRAFMLELARDGATVLTRTGRLRPDGTTDGQPVIHVGELAVAGYDDPLEGTASLADHDLELDAEQRDVEERRLVDWFRALPERPDVVLVHEHGLAHALYDAVRTEKGPPLLVLTGHDHNQHVHAAGDVTMIDGGTAGAGGPLGVGVQSAGFAQLHLDGTRLESVDLVQVEPLSGAASAQRLVVDGHGGLEPAVAPAPTGG